jgi:hypothetical protein
VWWNREDVKRAGNPYFTAIKEGKLARGLDLSKMEHTGQVL